MSAVDASECSGPERIARPAPWLVGGACWLVALLVAPALDTGGRVLPVLALVGIVGASVLALLAATLPQRLPRWAGPAAVAALAGLAVTTTLALGTQWWSAWIILAATAVGALPRRYGPVVVVVTPVAAVLCAGATGADGAGLPVLGLTVFLAGAANLVLVRLLHTIGDLRAAQRELAVRAVGEERERFSRDLHDLLGHTLSVMVVKAEAVRRLTLRDPEAAVQHALDIEVLGRQALVEVREAVDGYRRTTLAGELARARVALDAAGVEATLSAPVGALDPAVDEALAWVLREGVTNVVRHSGASRCRLVVGTLDGRARLELIDDGSRAAHGLVPGAGLTGLEQRLATVGGTLEVSATGEGFRLVATAPLSPAPVPPSVGASLVPEPG